MRGAEHVVFQISGNLTNTGHGLSFFLSDSKLSTPVNISLVTPTPVRFTTKQPKSRSTDSYEIYLDEFMYSPDEKEELSDEEYLLHEIMFHW